jgi:hypothetical protein
MPDKTFLLKYSDYKNQSKTAHLGIEGSTSWKDWWKGTHPFYLYSEELYGIVAAGEKLGGLGLIFQAYENNIVYSTSGEGGVNRKCTLSISDIDKETSSFLFKGKKGLTLTVRSDLDLYTMNYTLIYDEALTKNVERMKKQQLKEITPEEVLKNFPTITLIDKSLDEKLANIKELNFKELMTQSEVFPLMEKLILNEKSELSEKMRALSNGLKEELEKYGYDGILRKFKSAMEPEILELTKKLEDLKSDQNKLEEEISSVMKRKEELEVEAHDISITNEKTRTEQENTFIVQKKIKDVLMDMMRAINSGKSQLSGLIKGTGQMEGQNQQLEKLLEKINGNEARDINLELVNQYIKNCRTQLAGMVLATNHIEEENVKLENLISEVTKEEEQAVQ